MRASKYTPFFSTRPSYIFPSGESTICAQFPSLRICNVTLASQRSPFVPWMSKVSGAVWTTHSALTTHTGEPDLKGNGKVTLLSCEQTHKKGHSVATLTCRRAAKRVRKANYTRKTNLLHSSNLQQHKNTHYIGESVIIDKMWLMPDWFRTIPHPTPHFLSHKSHVRRHVYCWVMQDELIQNTVSFQDTCHWYKSRTCDFFIVSPLVKSKFEF